MKLSEMMGKSALIAATATLGVVAAFLPANAGSSKTFIKAKT